MMGPQHAVRHRRVELMLAAESDDVDAESLRSKETLQAHPYWRVNAQLPRSSAICTPSGAQL